ncbi:MAG: hypothetical protein ABI601_18615 [bacterium]
MSKSTKKYTLRQAIDLLDAGGVEFCAGGCTTLQPKHVERFVADPIWWWAKVAGVSRDDWLARLAATNPNLQCSAKTKQGRQCKHEVYGIRHANAAEFARLRGGYCHVHGGRP